MQFFKSLFEMAEGLDLTIRIKRKNENLTISVLPDAVNNVQPLIITGAPEELDEGFIQSITVPLQETKTLLINGDAFKKDVEAVVKKDKPKAEKSKQVPQEKQKPDEDDVAEEAPEADTNKKERVKKTNPKPKEEKAKEPAQTEKTGPQELTMF